MKIKEVIARTGLTDRAIRLYIENSLLTPENKKSHTGRNSFDFSEADIQTLNQIAILRKADFSIEEIKVLRDGGHAAKAVLEQYLEAKTRTVATGQRILAALQALPQDADLSLELLCDRIEAGLHTAPLPESDTKPSKGEFMEKAILRTISGAMMALAMLGICGILIYYDEVFPFPVLYRDPRNYVCILFPAGLLGLPTYAFWLYRKPLLTAKATGKRRIKAISALILAIAILFDPIGWYFITLMPPVYCETRNPCHYLQLGRGNHPQLMEEEIRRIFPVHIPRIAAAEDSGWFPPDSFLGTTKYYFRYEDAIDPIFDLYAEWVLSSEELEAELDRIRRNNPEGPAEQVQ